MFKYSKCIIHIFKNAKLKENDATVINDKVEHNQWLKVKEQLKEHLKTLKVKPTYYLNVATLEVDKTELNELYKLIYELNLRIIYIYGEK